MNKVAGHYTTGECQLIRRRVRFTMSYYVNRISKFATILAAALAAIVLTACGGDSSTGGINVSPPVIGGVFSSGDFIATFADNSIPPNVNAAPVAMAVSVVPVDIKVNSYETNVTSGAKAYTLKIGDSGFNTTATGTVRLEVPFDRSLVPDKTKIDSLHLILRILGADDNSVVTLTGQIVGERIVADLTGFPSSATVIVLFNPNMDVAINDTTPKLASNVPAKLASVSSQTWETRNWAVVYDAVEIAPEVQTFLGSGIAPSTDQIRLVVKQQLANHAADAAATYQGESFRSPTLYVAKSAAEAAGEAFGANPRYLLHFQKRESAGFVSEDRAEIIGPDNNHYGRIYIQDVDLNAKFAAVGMSIYGTIAHELFHAVQAGYGLSGKQMLRGVREGTATAYGDLLDRRHSGESDATPQVRQGALYPEQLKDETFKLDNYLLLGTRGHGLAYSNQDFFVYLARTIGNNNFKFLATLFEQLRLTAEDEANKQPTPAAIANSLSSPDHATVLKGFDIFFSGNYSTTLLSAYKDFVQQRSIEHNTESQFGRPDETTSGMAVNLFTNYINFRGERDVQIDPTSVSTTAVNDLRPMDSLSARAIRIRPVAGKTGGDITITVAPSTGTFGTTLVGWIYRTPSATAARTSIPLQASNLVSGFGADSSDEVIIILINPSYEISSVGVVCEIKGAEGKVVTLYGTYPSLEKTIDKNSSISVISSGSWSMTGAGIELTKTDTIKDGDGVTLGQHIYIYAPIGSQGKLTINNNAAWGNAPKEVIDQYSVFRTVYSYHALELMPFDLGVNYWITYGYQSPIVSKSIIGSAVIIDYLMASNATTNNMIEFEFTPQFGAYLDQDIYYVADGKLYWSDKNVGKRLDFFTVTVSTVKK